jgi:hypothetical protein
MHPLFSAVAALSTAAGPHLQHLAAGGTSDNGTPTTAPPGIFLKLFIFGGLSFVVFCAWFVLRGYRDTGDAKNKPQGRAERR